MKKLTSIILAQLIFATCFAQWSQKTSLPASERIGASSFVIGSTAYIAGGKDTNQICLNELWAYDGTNDVWTQQASFPGNGKLQASGFAINNFGYLCAGWKTNGAGTQDLMKYDPILNTWSTLAPFPGGGRYGATNIVINDKVYVGLGYAPLYDDFWEYDPATSTWTQKASFPPGPREANVCFSINGYGYVGTGIDQNGLSNGYTGLNDFNKYDPLLNTWSTVASIPGNPRHSAFVFVIGTKAYVGCGLNGNASTATPFNDFYEYNSISDSWTTAAPLPSTPRQSGTYFTIGNCGYIFGGFTQGSLASILHNDLWQYCNTTGVNENEARSNLILKYDSRNNMLNVSYANMTSHAFSLELHTSLGSKVMEAELLNSNPGQKSEYIQLPVLSTGIYFYAVSYGKTKFQTGKLLIN